MNYLSTCRPTQCRPVTLSCCPSPCRPSPSSCHPSPSSCHPSSSSCHPSPSSCPPLPYHPPLSCHATVSLVVPRLSRDGWLLHRLLSFCANISSAGSLLNHRLSRRIAASFVTPTPLSSRRPSRIAPSLSHSTAPLRRASLSPVNSRLPRPPWFIVGYFWGKPPWWKVLYVRPIPPQFQRNQGQPA
jgi:hypothetical protein